MACAPCAAQRKKVAEAARRGDVAEAAAAAVEGVAAMVGLKPKTELSGYQEQMQLPFPPEETADERKARLSREAHEKWLAQQLKTQ